jgi:ubiquinone/menaquinone biosynthesis C-methylase UbiE
MVALGIKKRAQRAMERQLAYQKRKAGRVLGNEAAVISSMAQRSRELRDRLDKIQRLRPPIRVLEVGSGAHGLIFYFDAEEKVGVDPLADHYRKLFPAWQERATTLTAYGERLPFDDDSFDVLISDNVVDHAENPRKIVEEMTRVLIPGGMLYFTVNIHHPVYHWAATLHAAWRAAGLPFEITPFADHTVHLTLKTARELFAGLALEVIEESNTIVQTKEQDKFAPRRHAGDRLKRLFFKNAQIEVIAIKPLSD